MGKHKLRIGLQLRVEGNYIEKTGTQETQKKQLKTQVEGLTYTRQDRRALPQMEEGTWYSLQGEEQTPADVHFITNRS